MRTPSADALHAAITAQPAGITVFVVGGIERAVFSSEDVARLFFGEPADADEATRNRELIGRYHRSGRLKGRRLGKRLLFSGAAVAEFCRWLDGEETHSKAA